MRIAVLHPSLALKGGAERVVHDLCVALSERGHRVELFTSSYDDAFYGGRGEKPFTIAELHVHGEGYGWATLLGSVKAGLALRRRLGDFDVVNVHNFPATLWLHFACLFGSSLNGVPKLWYCEEPPRMLYDEELLATVPSLGSAEPFRVRFMRNLRQGPLRVGVVVWNKLISSTLPLLLRISAGLDRAAATRFDSILANSRYTAGLVSQAYGLAAVACPLGVTPGPRPAPVAGGHLLTVTRMEDAKNPLAGILAVERLRGEGVLPFAKYVLVGGGSRQEAVAAFIASHGLGDVVQLRGFVSEDEKDALYARCAAMLSLPVGEPFGLTFLEAANHGKPVIAPKSGGPEEIVVDGVTGYLVDPLDVDAVAEAVRKLFESRDRMREMGERAYERLLEHYTFDGFVDRFEAHCEELVRGGGETVRERVL